MKTEQRLDYWDVLVANPQDLTPCKECSNIPAEKNHPNRTGIPKMQEPHACGQVILLEGNTRNPYCRRLQRPIEVVTQNQTLCYD